MTKSKPNSGKTQVQRDKKGRFPPGKSGNPSGPKPGYKQKKTVFLEAATRLGLLDDTGQPLKPYEDVVNAMVKKAKKGSTQAAEMIFDRIDGRPKQAIDVTSGDKPLSTLTLEQQARVEAMFNHENNE